MASSPSLSFSVLTRNKQQQQEQNFAPSASTRPQFNQQQQPPPTHQQQPQRPQPQPQQGNNAARSSDGPQSATTLTRSSSVSENSLPTPASAPLHPEISSVVQISIAHAQKIYFSGPLVRRFERQPDGQKPHKDEGWTEVWAELAGTTLSMKASEHVPPCCINVTDAIIQVLGSMVMPETPTTPAKRYTNVLKLNTARSNLLFSCPSTAALVSWDAALRLAAWEKSRLEEIYTAHLIRTTLNAPDAPTTLVQGKLEGYARVRIAGQTDWKRVWLMIQGRNEVVEIPGGSANAPPAHNTIKKRRMSNLFSRGRCAPSFPIPQKPVISIFAGPKPKDPKKPLMTVHSVIQAFGVYPERPELINGCTMMKVEGTFGDDDMAGNLRKQEGCVLIMPETENNIGITTDILKWIVALHDAFELYGRPEAWTWDHRDPVSLIFGYPVDPQRENLFLDREIVENMTSRDDRTSVMRAEMKKHLQLNLIPVRPNPPAMTEPPSTLPPIGGSAANNSAQPPISTLSSGPQFPPSTFGPGVPAIQTPLHDQPLPPITERSSILTATKTLSSNAASTLNIGHSPQQSIRPPSNYLHQQHSPLSNVTTLSGSGTTTAHPVGQISILNESLSHSPPPGSPTSLDTQTMMGGISATSMSTQPSTTPGLHPSFGSNANKSLSSIATSAPADLPKPQDIATFGKISPPISQQSFSSAFLKPQAHQSSTVGQSVHNSSQDEPRPRTNNNVDSDSQRPMDRGFQSVPSNLGMSSLTNSLKEQSGPGDHDIPPTPSHLRPARALPQIPGNKHGDDVHHPQLQHSIPSDPYALEGSRRTVYEDSTPILAQSEVPQPGAARHTPGRLPQPEQGPIKATFVQPETTAKAFTTHDLLAAGLQDEEDRSMRHQGELARESGTLLMGMPNKPLHTQTSLLGAISAHERERKREGGVDAVLTEREHEKYMAEERQREFNQRHQQQLEQMQQGGSMYAGQFGFNPMLPNLMMMCMNPMMGMNPTMTGGGQIPMMTGGEMHTILTGYPGIMMGDFNSQRMLAAQQTTQVYQQVMMIFSVAGSQVGGEGGGTAGSQFSSNMGGMNLAMGGVNPVMGRFEPRIPMMGMPMMGMGMGMGMGAPSVGPLPMQNAGISDFDFKSSPGLNNAPSAGNDMASRSSPLARGATETADRPGTPYSFKDRP